MLLLKMKNVCFVYFFCSLMISSFIHPLQQLIKSMTIILHTKFNQKLSFMYPLCTQHANFSTMTILYLKTSHLAIEPKCSELNKLIHLLYLILSISH